MRALERAAQSFPCARAGKEHLIGMENHAIPIGVEHPRRHVIAGPMIGFHCHGSNTSRPRNLICQRGVPSPSVTGGSDTTSTSGWPHTANIWLDRVS